MTFDLQVVGGAFVVGLALGAWSASLLWQRRCAALERDLYQLAMAEARARRARGDL